ncbi:hypothetical protein [Solidesulfovibrio sp.]|uniref:hypothetical protein n=1 Tax=Solidesulfovibrio sp. TaxID=2910990 RepID=UPI00261C710A|nr:hypothetical protein [Solidesulfovibrio sp.]
MDRLPIPRVLGPVDDLRRWLRILSILDACHWVGLAPIITTSLHVIVYLAEALSPAWNLKAMDGKVLKQSTAPYYPLLQKDTNRLIGMGLIRVNALEKGFSDKGDPVFLPKISLELQKTDQILKTLRELPDEELMFIFFREVVQAFSRLSDQQVPTSMKEDATYGDPAVDIGQVIDLGEWLSTDNTATSQAIDQIRNFSGYSINPAETIDIYVDHIFKRVSHG